ncbi:MAG: hypothetical protein NC131_01180 [Roseburia sp.]|nr:hypothetical protein [Roseburia sp.]
MKGIIKHGEESFSTICSFCGCEFTYEQEDIQKQEMLGITMNMSVQCPDCGLIVQHNAGLPKYKPEDIVQKIMIVKEKPQEVNDND